MSFQYYEQGNGFVAELAYNRQKISTRNENVNENVNEKLSLNQQKIIEVMKTNKKVTMEELAEIVGIAKTNVARNIKKLRNLDIVRRVGAAKGGHWEVK